MEFRTLIDRVFNRDKKSAFAGTYTDATGNDPQGRNRTPGGSARQGNTPNGSGQLSLFGEPASNGESPASPSSPQGNLFAEFTDGGTESEKYSNLACLR